MFEQNIDQEKMDNLANEITNQISSNITMKKEDILNVLNILQNSTKHFEQYQYFEDSQTGIVLKAKQAESNILFAIQIFIKDISQFQGRQDFIELEYLNKETNQFRNDILLEEIDDDQYLINLYILDQYIEETLYQEKDILKLEEKDYLKVKNIQLAQNSQQSQDFINNILKNNYQYVQRIGLKYSYSSINQQEMNTFGEAVNKFTNLQTLKISFWRTQLGEESFRTLLSIIQKCYQLTYLNLIILETQIGSQGALEIANKIVEMKQLTSINLYVYDRSITIDLKKIITQNILKIKRLVSKIIYIR